MARQLFDAAMEMAEDSYDRSMLLSTRGWVEEAAGQLDEALQFYEEAWRIQHAPQFKVWIAHIYFKKHDYAHAASLYENLMLHPRGINNESRLRIRYRFAECLEQLGREEEAIQVYDELRRIQLFSELAYTIIFDAHGRWQALKERRRRG
jgi:tetratricopeptide (TPR) repeat protein